MSSSLSDHGQRAARHTGCRRRSGYAAGVEIIYTGLLVAVALLVTWFAFYVVYRLVHEDK